MLEQRAVEQMAMLAEEDWPALLDKLQRLTDQPYQPCDVELPDINGRYVRLKWMGNFVITYWDDHPVKDLRIVSIEKR